MHFHSAGADRPIFAELAGRQVRTTTSPGVNAEAVAQTALAGPQDCIAQRCAVFQDRRDKVVAARNAIPGIRCHLPEGAFYVYPSCAELLGKTTPQGKVLRTDEDFVPYLLDEANLAVLQGDAYEMSPYFRISFATRMDLLEQGISRIAQAVERLR